MSEIALYRRGEIAAYALVDADDIDWLTEHRWSLGYWGYAERSTKDGNLAMHRAIMGLGYLTGSVVHHRNEDKLDNRRVNLHVFANHSDHARTPHAYWLDNARRWVA